MPSKDIYAVGEMPPIGHLPPTMHAWVVQSHQHGEPAHAFRRAVVPTCPPADNEVCVLIMAAGVNYNGVWAALGKPISVFRIHKHDFHIAGSDAAGIVWAVGRNVKRWKVGDDVVIHCNQVDHDDEEANGGDPMLSPSQRIWGYETPYGSFAQFSTVQEQQLLPRPSHLSWEASACYLLKLATAYRMLHGHAPHTLRPGSKVLVWGASGGLGVFALQLCRISGAKSVGVVSSEDKVAPVLKLGAAGVVNRRDFSCWGRMPDPESPDHPDWLSEVRRFGSEIWKTLGRGNNVDISFEHPGESTFPVSTFVTARGGMVVFCAATSGVYLSFDARYVWMHQKRIQGSHFAHMKQASEANRLVCEGKIDPCLSETFAWDDLPTAHERMHRNVHAPGNMAVRVGCSMPERGSA
jgi:crotonyl-CoA carboxylase/reductase